MVAQLNLAVIGKMNISKITYSVEATIPHPEIGYANMKPHISAEITLNEGDDPATAKDQQGNSCSRFISNPRNGATRPYEKEK